MNRHEKISWYNLVFTSLGVLGFFILLPYTGVYVASAMFGLLGFTGLSPLIFKETEITDERDQSILRRAQRFAHTIFWLYFVFSSVGIFGWHLYHNNLLINALILPLQVLFGTIIVMTIQSIVAISLYRRGIIDGKA